MNHDCTAAVRALKASALIGMLASTVMAGAGHTAWALGFALGSCLSIFSLVSLLVLVPMFMRPATPLFSRAMLMLTMVMKLPLYAAGLWLLSRLGSSTIFASVFGIALGPMVISANAVGELFSQSAEATPSESALNGANAFGMSDPISLENDSLRSVDYRSARGAGRCANGVGAKVGVSISTPELASERV